MKMKKQLLSFLFLFVLASGLFGADKLAVVEPVAKGGMKPQEIEALWSMLETSVDGGYELISRSAIKSMMTEIGFTTSSDLVNLNSTQKAKLGQIKTVKYIFLPTVSKFGSRLNVSFMVLDVSTGEIDPDRKTSETVNSLDELADKLPDILNEMGLGRAAKKRGISAILSPAIRVKDAPAYLPENFNVALENYLIDNNIRLQNLQSVARILKKNNIANLYEAEPAMFMRIGKLLRVDNLVQASINRYSVLMKKEYIKASNRTQISCIGNIEGNIRIISAQTGQVVASFPFRKRVNFDDIDEDTDDWTSRDYGQYLIDQALPAVCKKVTQKLK